MKRIFQFFLLSVFMTSCANVMTPNITVTPQAAITLTPAPTLTSTATATEDPLATAPEGTTSVSVDSKTYYMDTTENGVKYHFIYNKETEKWTREVGSFPLMDVPFTNYLLLTIRVNSDVKGANNLVSISHADLTMEDFNSNRDRGPTPLFSIFAPELRNRLGIASNSPEYDHLFDEMNKGKNSTAKLPFISSTGEAVAGILSTETGFILDIVNPADLSPLVGKGVTEWKDPIGSEIYLSTVTGVDEYGNILGKIAFEGDIHDLSDEQVKWMVFSIVASVIEREDQTTMYFTSLMDAFENFSSMPRKDGTQDVGIVRMP